MKMAARCFFLVSVMAVTATWACKDEHDEKATKDEKATEVESPPSARQPRKAGGKADAAGPAEPRKERAKARSKAPKKDAVEAKPAASPPRPAGERHAVTKAAGANAAAGPAPAVTSGPPGAPAAPPRVPAAPRSTGKGIPDLRLLLTVTDVAELSGGKRSFRRTALPGVVPSGKVDALYYEPSTGTDYGFGIQVFAPGGLSRARQKFESMLASYPNSVEVAPVSGKTFFAYWGDVLFVVFVHPQRHLVVALSCGRSYCDSDGIYGLAKKVGSRIK